MSDIKREYAGRSQEDILKRVREMTDQILKLRKGHTYGERVRLQTLRQRRAQLQELLTKPTIVWNAE